MTDHREPTASDPVSDAGTDYPRPDSVRDGAWGLLNGPWDFAPGEFGSRPESWPYTIIVPFGWETEASGVGLNWLESGWYRRKWEAPRPPVGRRLVLMFGAVQHECRVYVSGRMVAHHRGGQTPFEVDITAEVDRQTATGIELCIAVTNPVSKAAIPHGKQRSMPVDPYDSCSFSSTSGIWQSVWWQHRPAGYLAAVELHSRDALDGFDAIVRTGGVIEPGDTIALNVEGRPTAEADSDGRAELIMESPRLWSPEDPYLYPVVAELRRDGETVDRLTVVSGIRTIEVSGPHLYLNDNRVFVRGVLDQGFWPGHGWTAPSYKALTADLDLARRLGFTMVRKHIKLEDPRWLHYADQLGMLVWEEPASVSRYSEAATRAFSEQIEPMITRDRNHPSIIIWGLYNEEWGLDWGVRDDRVKQRVLAEAYQTAKSLDPSRPVIDNSGWEHVRTDLVDWHIYSPNQEAWVAELEWIASGSDSGFLIDLNGLQRKHLFVDPPAVPWAVMNSEYGTGHTSVERAWVMRWQTQELRRQADQNGYVYTELYDIEHEMAGLLHDDRSRKDDLGLESGDSHADTVIIVDVRPEQPGCDLRTATGEVGFDVWISHHGQDIVTGDLICDWGALGSRNGSGTVEQLAPVTVKPFELSGPIMVCTAVPAQLTTGRLHLWLQNSDKADVAHTSVDVSRGGDR